MEVNNTDELLYTRRSISAVHELISKFKSYANAVEGCFKDRVIDRDVYVLLIRNVRDVDHVLRMYVSHQETVYASLGGTFQFPLRQRIGSDRFLSRE